MARPRFDPARDFEVAGRGFTWNGQPMKAGDPFPKEGVPAYKLLTLYGARAITFSEKAAPADPVTVTNTAGSWYEVNAPWLESPVKVQGGANAEALAAEIRAAGEPAHHHGVGIEPGENGWWRVKADWAAEPENVRGEDAARARAAEMRAEGPPPDPRTEPTITPPASDGGQFLVNAPWLEQAEEFADGTLAEQRRIQLREAGPPQGWTPAPPAAE